MTRYYIFYQREDSFYDCISTYAENIKDAFEKVTIFFKDHNYPVVEIISISKRIGED